MITPEISWEDVRHYLLGAGVSEHDVRSLWMKISRAELEREQREKVAKQVAEYRASKVGAP